MSTLDEEFGPFPGRPTHPDMARLSAILRRNDALSERPGFKMTDFLAGYADPEVVLYLARNRVNRVAAMVPYEVPEEIKVALVAVWIDGIATGLAASAQDLPRDGQRRPR